MFFKALRTKEKLLFAIDKSDLNIKSSAQIFDVVYTLYPVPNFVENGYVMEDLIKAAISKSNQFC